METRVVQSPLDDTVVTHIAFKTGSKVECFNMTFLMVKVDTSIQACVLENGDTWDREHGVTAKEEENHESSL